MKTKYLIFIHQILLLANITCMEKEIEDKTEKQKIDRLDNLNFKYAKDSYIAQALKLSGLMPELQVLIAKYAYEYRFKMPKFEYASSFQHISISPCGKYLAFVDLPVHGNTYIVLIKLCILYSKNKITSDDYILHKSTQEESFDATIKFSANGKYFYYEGFQYNDDVKYYIYKYDLDNKSEEKKHIDGDIEKVLIAGNHWIIKLEDGSKKILDLDSYKFIDEIKIATSEKLTAELLPIRDLALVAVKSMQSSNIDIRIIEKLKKNVIGNKKYLEYLYSESEQFLLIIYGTKSSPIVLFKLKSQLLNSIRSCVVCDILSDQNFACPKCQNIYYCSKNCQENNSEKHNKNCC